MKPLCASHTRRKRWRRIQQQQQKSKKEKENCTESHLGSRPAVSKLENVKRKTNSHKKKRIKKNWEISRKKNKKFN